MLISLFPVQVFAAETTEDNSSVLTDVENNEANPSEDELPGEEVDILPLPEEEYEEIIEEPSGEPEAEPTEIPETPDEAENKAEDAEESAQKVSVHFNLTPADLTLKVYPAVDADSAESQEKTVEEAQSDASEPQTILPEEDGSYLLLPGEYYYDAECEGYIPTLGVDFTITEDAAIDVVLEADSLSSVMDTDTSSEYPTSGACGDKLKWSLDENGVLTISGTGAMYNYAFNNYAPWRTL